MKIRLLLLLILTCAAYSVSAQIPRLPSNILSPNAASLGQYGEIPVSPFTGIPSINVPLYTVNDGSISLSLALNYYAAGFRPDTHPGWVGAGWSLQAGGVITRTVNDAPDDFDADPSVVAYGNQGGYFWRYQLLNPTGPDTWNSSNYLNTLVQNGWAKADTQPDEFSFSYPGGSGKFYWSQTGTWQVESDKPVTVALWDGDQFLDVPYDVTGTMFVQSTRGLPKTFRGFRITAEDGTIYEFGNSKTAIDYSIGVFNQGTGCWTADAWYLTKIIYPTSRTVTFTYEPDTYVNQMYITYFTNNNRTSSDQNIIQSIFSLEPNCYTSSSPSDGDYFNGKLIRPVYLRSITTDNTTVWFDRSTTTELTYPSNIYNAQKSKHGNKEDKWIYYLAPVNSQIAVANAFTDLRLKWKKLYRIRVEQSGIPIKSFKLTYSDTDAAIGTPEYTTAKNTRLTLLGVQEFAGDGTDITKSKPAYKFSYYNDNAGLPIYLANENDHWGFFDARTSDVNYPADYSQRREANTDPTVYLRGVLTKVTYPTGGVTEFEYEQHTYSQEVNQSRVSVASTSIKKPAGGLRIKKTTSYSLDNPQNKLAKEFLYVKGYTAGADPTLLASSGVIGGLPQYSFENYCVRAYNSNSTSLCQTSFSTQPVIPATLNSQGSYVGYSQVIEKLADDSYTIHFFSNYDTSYNGSASCLDQPADNTLQTSHTAYEPFSSLEAARGKEIATAYYTPKDICVKRTDITYTKYGSPDFVRSIKLNAYQVCSNSAVTAAEGTAYRIYTDSYLPTAVTERLYDGAGQNPITTTRNLAYYPNRILSQEATTDSKGQSIQTAYKYCFNYPSSSATNPTVAAITAMKARNMVALPLETTVYKNALVTVSTFQTYQASGVSNITPYQTYQFEPVVPTSQYTGITYSADPTAPLILNGNDRQVKLKLSLDSYDNKGNILGLSQEGKQLTSYQWGYNSTLPVVKIDNAAPNEVFHSNFEEGTGWETDYFAYTSLRARTGSNAGVIISDREGDQYHSFSTTPLAISLTATKKYVLSGWVYSEGPTAQLWLFLYQPGKTRYEFSDYVYVALDRGDTGKWVYLQKEVDVPPGITGLNCRLTNFYSSTSAGRGRVWFDDVRIYPADAQMTTYTHRPGIGVTSISDANNKPTVSEYDELHRLSLQRDQDGNVVKQYQYHYKNK